jgi:hypothetical protein
MLFGESIEYAVYVGEQKFKIHMPSVELFIG